MTRTPSFQRYCNYAKTFHRDSYYSNAGTGRCTVGFTLTQTTIHTYAALWNERRLWNSQIHYCNQ